MLTVGVDLSAEPTNTWAATLLWQPGRATLVGLESKVGNPRIVEMAAGVDKVGVDCPLGWPAPFLDFVAEHMSGDVLAPPGGPIEWRRALAYRTTDLDVARATGLRPLSVAADRIAHAAMRCAALLAELSAAGIAIDRSGVTGAVVEVYPAASLRRWDLTHRGYKHRANLPILDRLVTSLLSAAPWLDLATFESTCRASDDAFDAVVAALSARAAACGLTAPPSAQQLAIARGEGWIAIPRERSLPELVESSCAPR